MTSSSEDNNSHTIAPSHQRCVWMTAGILSYQLCDRQFNCDECPLDAALRTHLGNEPRHESMVSGQKHDTSSSTWRDQFFYSKQHCWIERTGEQTVRIGIEPQLAALLLSPKAIVLPKPGDVITSGTPCCWIVTTGGTFPVRSPVSGTVLAYNNLLNEHPFEVRANPMQQGWLFETRQSGSSPEETLLLNKSTAEKIYNDDAARFKALLANAAAAGRYSIGMTLQDGGKISSDAAAILGPRRYLELLKSVFGER